MGTRIRLNTQASGSTPSQANLTGATFTGTIDAPGILLGGTSLSTLYPSQTSLNLTGATIHLHTLQLATKAALSGASFTGVISSGATDVSNLFARLSHAHVIGDVTGLQAQVDNITLHTAQLATKANLSGASFTGAITSGGTDLSNYFARLSHVHAIADVTGLQTQVNNITLHTAQLPTKANLSGATFTDAVSATTVGTNSLSATTIYSGSTNIATLFEPVTLYNFSTADQTVNAITTALVSGSTIQCTAQGLRQGTMYKFYTTFSKTNAGTASNEFQVRLGPAGSVADSAILTFQTGLGTGVPDTGTTEISVLVRGPLGGSCIAVGQMTMTHQLQNTGLSVLPIIVKRMTSSVFNSATPSMRFNVSVTTAVGTVFTFYDTTCEAYNI